MIYVVVGLLVALFAGILTSLSRRRIEPEGAGHSKGIQFGDLIQFLSYVVASSVYIVLAGIRYNVGTDYLTYTEHQIPTVLGFLPGSTVKVEFLYAELIKFGSQLGSYQYIFLFTHLIIILLTFAYIWKRSLNYALSLYIFMFSTFFSFSLNGMRQSIATAIFLFATPYIVNHKPIKYFVLIFVATLFHGSAYLYFLFYFLGYIHIKNLKNYFFTMLAISPVILLTMGKIHGALFWITSKIGLYGKFFGSVYDDTGSFLKLNLLWLVMNIFLIFLLTFFYSDSGREGVSLNRNFRNSFNLDANIQMLTTIFSMIAFVVPGSFRVIYMFIPIQMTFVPSLLSGIKDKTVRQGLTILIMVLYAILFYLVIIRWNYNETLPYQTFFSE